MAGLSVFKIQQSSAVPNKEQTKAIPLETSTESIGSPASETEPAVGNDQNRPGAETPEASPGNDQKDPKDLKDPKELLIKVDGPVGRVFTEALNRILATEGYMMMPPMVEVPDTAPAAPPTASDEITPNLIQVYCWRSDAINTDDIAELTSMVTKHTDRQYVVAMEAAATTSKCAGFLEDLLKVPNLKVCYSTESAANYIRGQLK